MNSVSYDKFQTFSYKIKAKDITMGDVLGEWDPDEKMYHLLTVDMIIRKDDTTQLYFKSTFKSKTLESDHLVDKYVKFTGARAKSIPFLRRNLNKKNIARYVSFHDGSPEELA